MDASGGQTGIFAIGMSADEAGTRYRAWRARILFGAAIAFAMYSLVAAHTWEINDSFFSILGVVAAAFLCCAGIGVFLIKSVIVGADRPLTAELGDNAVIFHHIRGSCVRIPYADIVGVAVLYAGQSSSYDHLKLKLYDKRLNERIVDDLRAPGERIEAFAEALRGRINTVNGGWNGDVASDRELRRRQRMLDFPKGRIALWPSMVILTALCLWGEYVAHRERTIRNQGSGTVGVVTKLSRDKEGPAVRYEFRDAEERLHKGHGRITRAEYDDLLLYGGIDVLYLPHRPEWNLPARSTSEAPWPLRLLLWAIWPLVAWALFTIHTGRFTVLCRGRLWLLRKDELEEDRLDALKAAGRG